MFSAREKSRTRPRTCRSSGMCPTPASSASRGDSRVMSSPATTMRPPSGRRRPVIASISSLCPLPSTPAIPTISRARTSKESPRTHSSPRSSLTRRSWTVRSGSPGSAAPLSTLRMTSRPTMRRARPSSVAPSRGTVSIVFPRLRTVMRSAISRTSFSLWLMKMIDFPSALQRIDDLEELARLLRREHRRGLVQDEDLGTPVERLEDLHPLLHADADRLDAGTGPDREPEALGEFADPGLGLAARRGTALSWARRRGRCSPPPSSPG